MSDRPPLPANAVFAEDFRVIRVINRGTVNTVYEAEQLSTGRRRALKVLHKTVAPDSPSALRFFEEARVRARVDSEHLAEVSAAGIDRATGTLWIAMEFLDGETLASHLHRLGPGRAMADDDVWFILDGLCRAMAAVHEAGVVHRDLKPANVFIGRTRTKAVVKLLDFGSAFVVGQARDEALQGTPLWMSPEQVLRTPISPSSDVWALGLLAFRLFTGQLYWRAAARNDLDTQRLFDEIIGAPIALASARARELGAVAPPAGFDTWFSRCVAYDPETRFRDARDAGLALTEFTPVSATLPALDESAPVAVPTRAPAARSAAPTSLRSSVPTVAIASPPLFAPPANEAHDDVHAQHPDLSDDALTIPVLATTTTRPSAVPPVPQPSVAASVPAAVRRPGDPLPVVLAPAPPPTAPVAVPTSRRLSLSPAAILAFAVVFGGGTAVLGRVVAMSSREAPQRTTRVAPPLNPRSVLAGPPAWVVGLSRAWSGAVSSDRDTRNIAISVMLRDNSSVTGHLAWTMVRSDDEAAIGTQATERVTGSYEPTLGAMELVSTPTTGDAPPRTTWRLRVLADGTLVGITADTPPAQLIASPLRAPR